MGSIKWLQRMSLLRQLARFLIATSVLVGLGIHHSAAAQSTGSDWAEPVNISHSGAATNPTPWVDASSTLHVIWQDAFANFIYAQLADGQWSAPTRTQLHQLFGLPASTINTDASLMRLAAGPDALYITSIEQYVVAVWLTSEGALYSSRVLAQNVTDAAAWAPRALISASTAAFAVAVDARLDLHLAYLQTSETDGAPAGVYYTRYSDAGLNRTVSSLLYASPYFRGLNPMEGHLSLAATEAAEATTTLYVAWDNRSRKQVLLTTSPDGGASWQPPMKVAGPAPASEQAGPFHIQVGTMDNHTVLVWQYGQPGSACAHFSQFSKDGGDTWSKPALMLAGWSGCAQVNELLRAPADQASDLLYLVTVADGEGFLSAWDGSRWSTPQLQATLNGFEDRELFSRVDLGCHRTTWLEGRLYVLGCDTGAGGDIWVTHRSVETAPNWFIPSVWSEPVPIAGDSFRVTALELLAAPDSTIHAFFAQRDDPSIYYTRWDGVAWSRITAVLKVPSGAASQPVAVVGPGNLLFLLAHSSLGSVYLSRADSAEAVTSSGWSPAIRLNLEHDGMVGQSDVVWDPTGIIQLVYSVPVNDGRGIYLTQSTDLGVTWSASHQVFDGAQAGFELVGAPTLWLTGSDIVHILWQQAGLRAQGEIDSLALLYAHSEDAGVTFTDAEVVVGEPVAWQAILGDTAGNVHRLWKQTRATSTIFDQVSFDNGRTWQVAQQLPAEWGAADATLDSSGQLHLIGSGTVALEHWRWASSRWLTEAPARWTTDAQPAALTATLASAVNAKGTMLVLFGEAVEASADGGAQLLFSTRKLDLPLTSAVSPTPASQASPAPTAVVTAAAPTPSSEPVGTTENAPAGLPTPPSEGRASNILSSPIIAYVPVAGFLLLMTGLVVGRILWARSR